MATNILMPALSPTMTEGTLSRWLKKEGEAVRAGDVIAEIETDKATMEVEAVDEGVLGKILVADGTQGVKVNEPIAILVNEGEAVPTAAPAAKPVAAPAPAPKPNPPGRKRNSRRRRDRHRKLPRQPATATTPATTASLSRRSRDAWRSSPVSIWRR
jgi:pyruvate dehydrogenase E2 component (dihydrolipoamide acetyltransferase)